MQASAVEGKRHSLATDYIMKILGLDICADTVVGNDMLRGISGGQRKRVTTGKTLKHTIALILYIRSLAKGFLPSAYASTTKDSFNGHCLSYSASKVVSYMK